MRGKRIGKGKTSSFVLYVRKGEKESKGGGREMLDGPLVYNFRCLVRDDPSRERKRGKRKGTKPHWLSSKFSIACRTLPN